MTKIGDGSSAFPPAPTRVGHAKVEGSTIEESTTPMQRAPAPAADPKTMEEPEKLRAPITDESKAFARGVFSSDMRASQLETKLESQVTQGKEAAHICGPGCNHGDDGVHGHAHAGKSATDVGALPGPRPKESTFTDVKTGTAALESKYGVKVKAGNWKPEELSRLHESFAKMSPKELEAMKGVEIRREAKAPSSLQAKNQGTVAGVFDPGVDTDGNGKRSAGPSITYYDAAFPTTKVDTKGMKPDAAKKAQEDAAAVDRRTTQHVALHEAGHAVEGRAAGDVLAAHNIAADGVTNASKAEKLPLREYQANVRLYGEHINGLRMPMAQVRTQDAFTAASKKADKALLSIADAKTDKELTAAKAAYATAAKEQDAAVKKMGTDHPSYSQANDIVTSRDALASKRFAYGDANVVFKKAETEANKSYAVLDNPDTKDVNETKTKKLQDFEKSIGKEKAVSEYGATGSHENFAEAYAMYRRDPDWLNSNHPKAYAYMKKNYP